MSLSNQPKLLSMVLDMEIKQKRSQEKKSHANQQRQNKIGVVVNKQYTLTGSCRKTLELFFYQQYDVSFKTRKSEI